MKDRNVGTIKVLLCMLDLLMISFIFINSIFSADISSSHSLGVREFLNHILSLLNIDFVFTEHVVRKCAHFAEFFILGGLFYTTALAFADKIKHKVLVPLSAGLLVAIVDEFIQMFSPGRSAQFTDVALDFFGVITCTLLLYFVFKLINRGKDKEGSNWTR